MRPILVVVLCCVVLHITFSQRHWRRRFQNPLRLRHMAALRQFNANHHHGPMHFHGTFGKLPPKYLPLTSSDEYAAYRISSIVTDISRFLPTVYTINQIAPINFDLPEYWLRGKLFLNKLIVRGINEARLQHLEARLNAERFDFDAFFPHISIDVFFVVEGYVGVVPLHISGSVSLPEQDLNPTGAFAFKKVMVPSIGEVFQADSADISVDVQSILININNDGSIDLDEDVNVIKAKVLHEIKDKAADYVLAVALKEINKELAKIPASDVVGFLTKNY